MKKILLASAFTFIGTFAMANEKNIDNSVEKVDITSIEKVDGGGSLLVITRVYGCNGEFLGSTSGTVDCPSCEGANIKVVKTVQCESGPAKPSEDLEG